MTADVIEGAEDEDELEPLTKAEYLILESSRLIEAGEWPGRIAQRLGYKNVGTLTTALQRLGRHDLADRMRLNDRASTFYKLATTDAEDKRIARERHSRR